MPSTAANHTDRQSQPGSLPTSQSTQTPATDQSSTRISKKKAKKAARREANILETEGPLADEHPSLPSPSPPRLFPPRKDNTPEELQDNGDHVRRPVLDPLGNFDFESDLDPNHRTNTWTKSIPYGVSPPIDLPDPNSSSNSPLVAPQLAEQGGFNGTSPPLSPSQRHARPVSHGGQISTLRQRSSEKNFRHHQGNKPFAKTPLPHLPQAHFYGAPDINLGLGDWPNVHNNDDAEQFKSFDRIPTTDGSGQVDTMPCLLIGSSGRLDVLAVEADKLRMICRLQKIRGDVLGAKILPLECVPTSYSSTSPLIVVLTHGPRVDNDEEQRESSSGSDDSEAMFDKKQTPAPSHHTSLPDFQTRVDVFSIATKERVDTLFVSRPTPSLPGIRGYSPSPPPPVGELSICCSGKFIALASATSGEVFVYNASEIGFRCLAKLWTTTQSRDFRKYSSSSGSADSDASPADQSRGQQTYPLPLLSLNGRWLAIVPPSSPSRPSINGVLPPSVLGRRVLGLDRLNAPSKPPATCIIESPDAESILNRVARGVAKEVVKGAKWLGEQGMQTWHNYWNRDASPPQSSAINSRFPPAHETMYNIFPPTHAPEARSPTNEPDVVSIFDMLHLERLGAGKAVDIIPTVATFQPPGGCSFLSFAPTGLTIMTATRKGDIQYIWDLMQISHVRAASLVSTNPASVDGDMTNSTLKVRQIAKYARLSSSSIVDVLWTDPLGDRFALLTRNGTIHIFDLPQSAFQWPPPRKVSRAPPQSPGLSPARASDFDATSGVLASAMKFAGKTQPILANLRGRAPSIGATFSGVGGSGMGFASATGVRGGKAVAAGLSKSVGAASDTVTHLRHAGDNRVHLNGLAKDPRPNQIAWIKLRGELAVGALDGGVLRTFKLKRREIGGKQSVKIKVSVIDARSATERAIPSLEQLFRSSEPETDFRRSRSKMNKQTSILHATHPLSRAELETNAPYQPFHSDRRVTLFVYKANGNAEVDLIGGSFTSSPSRFSSEVSSQQTANKTSQWVFGNEISTTKLTLRVFVEDDNGHGDSQAETGQLSAGQSSTIIRQTQATQNTSNPEDPIEQIVITTRRKKNKVPLGDRPGLNGDLLEDDGFFEDDCEVLDWAGDRV